MNLNEIIKEFKKFDRSVFENYSPTDEASIKHLENKINQNLPRDFKEFLLISNGASINCHEFYGIKSEIPAEDLFDNYFFETKEAGNSMPDYYLPIYPDGMGNHNCLDLKSLSSDGKKCDVIFWQHDRSYSIDDPPEVDANSFTQFLENLLKELSMNYNYNGTEK